jgi:hypothetical protein
VTIPRLPGTVGSPLAASMRRTAYLLANRSRISGRGPMNVSSWATHASANDASSLRNPYPG